MAKTNGERLAVLETKVEDLKIIVKEGFNEMNKKLDSAASKLDEASTDFVTKEVFDHTIAELKRKTWQQNTLSAILGAVLTFLVGFAWLKITGG
jgi:hypothetical protein